VSVDGDGRRPRSDGVGEFIEGCDNSQVLMSSVSAEFVVAAA
jgi:hypothetical protein